MGFNQPPQTWPEMPGSADDSALPERMLRTGRHAHTPAGRIATNCPGQPPWREPAPFRRH